MCRRRNRPASLLGVSGAYFGNWPDPGSFPALPLYLWPPVWGAEASGGFSVIELVQYPPPSSSPLSAVALN